jgi:hypothetical protein
MTRIFIPLKSSGVRIGFLPEVKFLNPELQKSVIPLRALLDQLLEHLGRLVGRRDRLLIVRELDDDLAAARRRWLRGPPRCHAKQHQRP